MKITSEPFAGLGRRLNAAAKGVETHSNRAMDVAVDEGREMLRADLDALGAPDHVITAVRTFKEAPGQRAIGVAEADPASDDALEFEFGDGNHFKAPTGTFRMMSPEIAELAADEFADRLTKVVMG